MNLAYLAYKMKKMKKYDVRFALLTDGAENASSVKRLIEILENEVKLQGINYSIKNIKVKNIKVKQVKRKARW